MDEDHFKEIDGITKSTQLNDIAIVIGQAHVLHENACLALARASERLKNLE